MPADPVLSSPSFRQNRYAKELSIVRSKITVSLVTWSRTVLRQLTSRRACWRAMMMFVTSSCSSSSHSLLRVDSDSPLSKLFLKSVLYFLYKVLHMLRNIIVSYYRNVYVNTELKKENLLAKIYLNTTHIHTHDHYHTCVLWFSPRRKGE